MEAGVGRREKLVEKIRARPPAARFSDVRNLLLDSGWEQDRQKGSHVTFVKREEFPITVPIRDGKVGRVYLDLICERLELDQ
jgi:predicted RNA binding protein YcfA (HicA-like mRNA interferase family)